MAYGKPIPMRPRIGSVGAPGINTPYSDPVPYFGGNNSRLRVGRLAPAGRAGVHPRLQTPDEEQPPNDPGGGEDPGGGPPITAKSLF